MECLRSQERNVGIGTPKTLAAAAIGTDAAPER